LEEIISFFFYFIWGALFDGRSPKYFVDFSCLFDRLQNKWRSLEPIAFKPDVGVTGKG